jgi:hypothetical protein
MNYCHDFSFNNCFILLQEEIAAINLSKYRKAQSELEDAEERAESSEASLTKLRTKNRSSVSTTRTIKSVSVSRASPSVGIHIL